MPAVQHDDDDIYIYMCVCVLLGEVDRQSLLAHICPWLGPLNVMKQSHIQWQKEEHKYLLRTSAIPISSSGVRFLGGQFAELLFSNLWSVPDACISASE